MAFEMGIGGSAIFGREQNSRLGGRGCRVR